MNEEQISKHQSSIERNELGSGMSMNEEQPSKHYPSFERRRLESEIVLNEKSHQNTYHQLREISEEIR
jgi:hypothetical protein